jgi:hypothetical protein
MEDSHQSEGVFLAELINDAAASALDDDDDAEAMMDSVLDEVIEWAQETKKCLKTAFKKETA